MGTRQKVVLGMSGGVDSSTAAILLMRAGFEVVGVTALFLDNQVSAFAANDARAVCDQLGIAHLVRDYTQRFKHKVITPFIEEYVQGLTPNPCVKCNTYAKIPLLIEIAHELGCDKVATGHYARIAQLKAHDRIIVKTALDHDKDQSYMLSQLTQDQLRYVVLPLGASTKAEVRIIAEDVGLTVASKKESQDICFIEGSYYDFLSEHGLAEEPGDIVDCDGNLLGRHRGLAAYTMGQRKGIGVAGPEPYYVTDKRKTTNELVVGFSKDTFITKLVVDDMNWQAFECLEMDLECMVKLRYRSQAVACVVEPLDAMPHIRDAFDSRQSVLVRLRNPCSITAPGQFAVLYQGEDVVGSGVISATMSE